MDTAATRAVITPRLHTFARRLRDERGAERVLLFGPRVLGDADPDSDFDFIFIVVSPRFEGVGRRERTFGIHDLWYASGGDAPLSLLCVTPDELAKAGGRATFIAAVLPEAVDLLTATPSVG